ncbi:MAG: phenylacetate-CoA ligase [Hyphomicrobiales bacterium]|jgi:phenylacetate-CoA ligase|nr:phenylacetate-CoA ligase [Hyphomicrobiales bacterium]
MIEKVIEQVERLALRMEPQRAVRLLNAMPPSAIEALQRARFRQTLRLAAGRSPFYREEFRRRGIDVRRIEHPSELGDFYTTGEDLRARVEDFKIGRADTAYETTGTTSPVPKRVFFSQSEINEMGRASAVALYFLGLRREDTVLSAFDCSFWVSPATVRSAFQYIGCFHTEAGKIDPEDFYEHALFYRPNVIFGEPSWMVRLSDIAAKRGVWPLKFLFAGGENISESARQAVEQTWASPLYLSYGQTESFGSMGIECVKKEGYHRNDLHFIFEVTDPDDTGSGELVYTTLTRNVMPLIRYRSTDLTHLVDEPCECGFFAKRIAKIRARTDEMVVCGMGNVGPWVFAELLRDVPGPGTDWQAVVKHDGRRDVIELHVELESFAHQAEVEKALLQHLRERFSDFWKNYEMRLYDFRIVPCALGSLRGGRKLKRVLDERQMALRRVI